MPGTTHHNIVVGIDLGGTNLRIAALRKCAIRSDKTRPDVVAHCKQPVGTSRNPEAVVETIHALVAKVVRQSQCPTQQSIPVGVGVAAMLRDRQGYITNSPHLQWRNVPFGEMLQNRFGKGYDIYVYNDVEAITYAEYCVGAGRKQNNILVVFVGTGIGGGAIVEGQLLRGAHFCAGEIGHMKVSIDANAPLCACGGRGCIEAYAGGADLLRRIQTELATGIDSKILHLAGSVDQITLSHLDAAASQQDPYASRVIGEAACLLGQTLSNAVTLLNPALLVLGGGVFFRTPHYRQQTIAALRRATTTPSMDKLDIVNASLGDDAGVLGAGLLADLQ